MSDQFLCVTCLLHVEFGVLMAIIMKSSVFWVVPQQISEEHIDSIFRRSYDYKDDHLAA
jgi:hypothetical protein